MTRHAPTCVPTPLWTHRGLIWQFTLRNVELRHKGSHLGLIWSFLNPLLMLVLYVFVFGFIFGGSFGGEGETRMEYALGIFLGLSLFHFLAETIGQAPALIVTNPNFVKKVVFPLEVLPAAAVGASLVHLVISLTLVLIGVAAFGPGVGMGLLWLPLILLPLLLIAVGLAWLLAALGTFLRDLAQATQFLSMALMFSSAIFYPASKIPPAAWQILRLNPLLLAVELARDAVLWDRALNLRHLGYLYVAGIFCAWLGYTTFRRMKSAFADVL
ncbi:ABC transporter permease [Opitutaceae bacterium]